LSYPFPNLRLLNPVGKELTLNRKNPSDSKFMSKIILHLATSLDGMIADRNGMADWLNDYLRPDEDYGLGAFFKTSGSAIMGSKTYEQSLSHNYWFGNMEGFVFTSRQLPTFKGKSISFINGNARQLVQELRQKEKDSWLVGGSSLISQFINDNLLDEMTITMVPKLIGKGIPLFQEIREIRQVQLSYSKNFKDGVVQLSYRF
jgi:dihydrofolate reductase